MNEIKIKAESKVKRCEICHQTDMFEQEKELCLRCIKIAGEIFRKDLNDSFSGTEKFHLTSTNIDPFYLGIIVSIVTLVAHSPLICLIGVAPPFFSGIIFFCVEAFIISFSLRWKKEIARGVFAAVVISIVFKKNKKS